MGKVSLYGGPYDGDTARTISGDFMWSNGVTCFREPGPKRALYRKVVAARSVVTLIFVGHVYVYCSCGGYHQRGVDRCTLCDAPLR